MAEWQEAVTGNPEVRGSSLLSDHRLDLFTVTLCRNPRPRNVIKQFSSPLTVGILKNVQFIELLLIIIPQPHQRWWPGPSPW